MPYEDGHRNALKRPAAESAWQLGQRLEARGAIDPAIRLYRFAAGVSGDPPYVSVPDSDSASVADAAVRLGRLLHDRGKLADAVLAWDRAAALGSIDARVLVAEAVIEGGDHRRGVTELRAALEALRTTGMPLTRDYAWPSRLPTALRRTTNETTRSPHSGWQPIRCTTPAPPASCAPPRASWN